MWTRWRYALLILTGAAALALPGAAAHAAPGTEQAAQESPAGPDITHPPTSAPGTTATVPPTTEPEPPGTRPLDDAWSRRRRPPTSVRRWRDAPPAPRVRARPQYTG